MDQSLLNKIALSLIPGIGGVLARNLVSYTGSVEGVFTEPVKTLQKIPGIGEINAKRIKDKSIFIQAEKELVFIEKQDVGVLFYTEKEYPRRLKSCTDAPVLLYTKGNLDLNAEKVLSIVGTRNATPYGKQVCDELIEKMAEQNYRVLIISGLAYGIDIQAHKSAMKHGLPTAGVIAHGLDKLYPSLHTETARKMTEKGGLVTDFPSNTKIDPSNFIRRNRIVAGLSDATIVVESAEKGGALITAEMASSYNRDVFAFPGRAGDAFSKGCNQLIRNNGASLIEGIEDLEYFMGWEKTDKKRNQQPALFVDLSPDEEKVIELLLKNSEMFVDQFSGELTLPVSRISALLLGLEFKNLIVSLPGKMYRLR